MDKKIARLGPALFVLAATLMGCQSNNPSDQTQPTTAESPEAGGGEKKRAAKKEGEKSKEKEAAAAQQVTIPTGTALDVRLASAIDTGKATEGSSFSGTLASPITVNGVVVASAGAAVSGTVTHVVSSGRLSKPAELSLTLNSLTLAGGEKVDISTDPWTDQGQSHKKRNAELIGGGAGVGALVGAIAGGKKGAAIGALAGGGGGTAAAAYTGKKEIVLAAETKLSFKLASAVTVTVSSKG